ncbi:MAG: dephospho-CoA kinase [Bacteroidales bacterium]|nr:dephospho-CoA kinase [Candidatus Liminaster caballi]
MTIITGGIGCGKSVVSRLLRVMGYDVYDCDSRAKWLMLHDPLLVSQLCEAFGQDTYLPDGQLNKPYLSQTIFSSPERLRQMNDLVHPAVARDILRLQPSFVETAIYFESHFDRFVKADRVWCVAAPLELRIQRTMSRDDATRAQVEARMSSQLSQEEKIKKADSVIWNDEVHSVIDQVNRLIIL